GLAQPERGSVHLAGAPVAALAPAALARLRVLVPQEAYVRTGTLADNLRYLRPDVDEATLESAVDALGARPLVARLGGLAAEIDPAALSAGERQLLAAVRAYLAPAPLVILDEATCHLDPMLEATVEDAFARRPGTLVVVAHRISSATRADRVLVFDGDRQVLGTHEELPARSPTYRELVGLWQHAAVPSGAPLGGPWTPVAPSDPAGLTRDAHRLDPRPRPRLAGDPSEMVPHRTRSEPEHPGDLHHRRPGRGQVEDLHLP
ncbi:ABC transporter ATP-binding protein, partial [Micromonospora sp. NPDC049799]|uniref:ABC transporter ATP-binding protein n=1 Tax=Micromonospora sp. NPDC049799 TaxID=3154741 RepID=UPI0033CA1426